MSDSKPLLSIIVAVSQNDVIGRDGDLPWKLSADLKRFKSITMGHPIVMGRKTYESIGRLLPGRTTVIITRQQDYAVEGAIVVHSIEEALSACSDTNEIFVIGGAEIFNACSAAASRYYLTTVNAEVDGDTYLDKLSFDGWKLTEESQHPADDKNQFPHTFQIYERRND